jgi:hypothetical protein
VSENDVAYLESDGDDGATDFLAHHELFAQHGQDQVFPAPKDNENGGFWSVGLRNKRSRGPLLTSPLGANFDPRGEFCPLWVKLSPGGEILYSPLHSPKQ